MITAPVSGSDRSGGYHQTGEYRPGGAVRRRPGRCRRTVVVGWTLGRCRRGRHRPGRTARCRVEARHRAVVSTELVTGGAARPAHGPTAPAHTTTRGAVPRDRSPGRYLRHGGNRQGTAPGAAPVPRGRRTERARAPVADTAGTRALRDRVGTGRHSPSGLHDRGPLALPGGQLARFVGVLAQRGGQLVQRLGQGVPIFGGKPFAAEGLGDLVPHPRASTQQHRQSRVRPAHRAPPPRVRA